MKKFFFISFFCLILVGLVQAQASDSSGEVLSVQLGDTVIAINILKVSYLPQSKYFEIVGTSIPGDTIKLYTDRADHIWGEDKDGVFKDFTDYLSRGFICQRGRGDQYLILRVIR